MSEILSQMFPKQVAAPPHQYVKRVRQACRQSPADHFFLRLDIKDYYPSIDHKILMRILRRTTRQVQFLKLLERAIKTPTGNRLSVHQEILSGVPQGLSISNILSSIYLTEIDRQFENRSDLNYFRFVDDILVLGTPDETQTLSQELPSILKRKRKLVCHPVSAGSKSTRVGITEGIDYLGYNFSHTNLSVRASSFRKMFSNLVKLITGLKYSQNKAPLIWRLNLRISGCIFEARKVGWMFYFSQTENKQQLRQLDAFLMKQAGQWLDDHEIQQLKNFTRAYHEIRYNNRNSRYFPNFDDFDDEQKRKHICILLPRSGRLNLESIAGIELTRLFHKCISHEIRDLEKDMLDQLS